ncbi:MAG TPA: hypothetical protein DCQ68_18370 [Chryseobacterium indologenes]|uniref:hypothetical protein n=1 Tax=Chryseobacterium indologenes TaxID=253 RepID=UPI000EDE9598|nr:hypothetical protein [Chryseobacterium indologenes]QIX83308.1 hypothetical protein FOB56_19560 [Chryseobacterium indologenes]TLX23318.1 hypothetical protein FE904_22545 [Chryseobacterium indologenes]UDQ52995.1 hypothetical protein LJF28_16340 [Chryseobacterium indologenes]HAO29089.1 hypothetical protein [Chryseobacterium indologenes]
MENKIKLIFTSICMMVLSSCKSQNNTSVMSFIKTYIDENKNNPTISSKENVLIVGSKKEEKDYWVYVYLINPKYMSGFKYTNVYLVDGYKTIVDESLDKAFLESIFKKLKKLPLQNFNLAQYPYSYNPNMWRIVFNNKNEVILISPQDKAEAIKNILEKKGVKFSKDYEE